MNTEITNYSSYLQSSTCYRYIENDDNVIVRLVIIGLSYNVDELCRVFANKLTENEKQTLNRYKKSYISFEDKRISVKQIESIRESKSTLHNQLVAYLIQKYDIDVSQTREEQLNNLSNRLKVKILIYKSNKDIFYQSSDHEYIIYGVIKNHAIWGISDIKHFKSTHEVIQAGEKKKKSPHNDIPVSNINKTPKSYEEQVEIFKKLKAKPFGNDVVKELVTSLTLDFFLNYIDNEFDPDNIREWEYAISCNRCNFGECFVCDGFQNFKRSVKLYTKRHECCKIRTRCPLISKCSKCNMYKFSGLKHTCKENRKAVKYSFQDDNYSLYINEIVD